MKIAYCFLVYDIIVPYSIWNDYFKNVSSDTYNVFIHAKYVSKSKHLPYTFNYEEIQNPIQTIHKSHISIVNATLWLWERALQDKNISHIVFLSQNCVPLYSFDILNYFIGSLSYSVISCIQGNKKERHHQLHPSMQRKIPYRFFVKQQPNMILTRQDADRFVKYPFMQYFASMECPDEHYFINIMIHVFQQKFFLRQTHYCNPDIKKTQAIVFDSLTDTFLQRIRSNGFLFLRKVQNHPQYTHLLLFQSKKKEKNMESKSESESESESNFTHAIVPSTITGIIS